MQQTVLPLLAALLLAAFLPVAAGQAPSVDDVVVAEDTTWTLSSKTIPHDLVVRAPATLRLEGVDLQVGHLILVEQGARLELGPSGATPTRLTGLDGTIDETHGFWMQVNGTLASSGTPRTEISGMRGSGLNNLYFPGGGIQVVGRAELADVFLHDSNGTVIAKQGGFVLLERAEVADMGFLNVGALAPVEIRDSLLRGASFGLMGRTLCDFTVERTTIRASSQAVMVNGCPARVTDSNLEGDHVGLYAAGSAAADLRDVRITGYKQDGIQARMLPNEVNAKVMDYPLITAEGVTLKPGPSAAVDSHGISLSGSLAKVANSTIEGNFQGIFAKDNSLIGVTGTSFVRNKANAIFLYHSRMEGDLMGNDYGGIAARNPNGLEPVDSRVQVRAVVLGDGGVAAPGTVLRVFVAGNSTPFAEVGGPEVAYAQMTIRTHGGTSDLVPTFLGPFTYEVTHPSLAEPVRGDLDLADPAIVVPAPAAPTGTSIDWSSVPLLLLLGGGALLVLLGLLPRRFVRLPFRRRPAAPTTPS